MTTTLAHLEQAVLHAQILLCEADVYTACLVRYQAPHVKTKLVLTPDIYNYIYFRLLVQFAIVFPLQLMVLNGG